MSKTDENIKSLLQEKFASHESPVNPEIWNSISNSMAGASTSASTGISIAKILGIAAAAIIATVTVLYVVNSSDQSQNSADKATPQSIEKPIEPEKLQDQPNKEISTLSPKEPSVTTASTASVVSASSNQQNELVVEDINNGKWNDYNEDPQSSSSDKKQNIEERNNTAPNQKSNSNTAEEPLSASFHTKVVDANTLRYFFFPKTSANASFKWTSSDGHTSSEMTFSHQFNDEGNYSIELTVTDNSGNIATESTTVQVVKPIAFKIPNAFSPGINGKNDVINFEESTQNEASISSVTIFDRNGAIIYESNNDFIWNGSNKSGELAQSGVYTYVITAIDKLGETRMNKGTIQLFGE